MVSVPANIAEGQGRSHTREFLHLLSIAYGSLMEVETHIEIASRLKYIDKHDAAVVLGKTSELGGC
ncbi:MAG TPA: four helix bundle protein [Blastocatellia bacterium]|nr:four helix bundle protein [Blastocatellia bacterium]